MGELVFLPLPQSPPVFRMYDHASSTVGRLCIVGRLFLIAIAIGLATGCSDGRLKLGEVAGTVTLDGKPLSSGKIVFQSDSARSAFGQIRNGEIVDVATYETGDGVPVGLQRIAIQPDIDESVMMKNPAEAAKMMKAAGIPQKFQQARTSGLTAEIKYREVNRLTIDIARD